MLMDTKITKLWNLLKNGLNQNQQKTFDEITKKHREKVEKIQKQKKAFLKKMATKKKKAGTKFKIAQSDRKHFAKFSKDLHKADLAMRKTSKTVARTILREQQKNIQKLQNSANAAKQGIQAINGNLDDLKNQIKKYKIELKKASGVRKAGILKNTEKIKSMMRQNLRMRKTLTTFTEKIEKRTKGFETQAAGFKSFIENPVEIKGSVKDFIKSSGENKKLLQESVATSKQKTKAKSPYAGIKQKIAALAKKRPKDLQESVSKYNAKTSDLNTLKPSATPKKRAAKLRGLQ